MSGTTLPDGLKLAVTLLEGDRDAFVVCHRHPTHGLELADAEIAGEYISAIDAIRTEHAQHVTLQHHAADQAQRIAELEAERDELRAELEATPEGRALLAAAKAHLMQCIGLTPAGVEAFTLPTACAMQVRPCRCGPEGCSDSGCAGHGRRDGEVA